MAPIDETKLSWTVTNAEHFCVDVNFLGIFIRATGAIMLLLAV